ncbi:MAG: hypothetical protein IJN15_02235 [Clostridia bacterium]|nr:hypothetical protein [Clostridia bacterium]
MRILVLILVIITILCGCNKTTIDSDINTSRPTEALELYENNSNFELYNIDDIYKQNNNFVIYTNDNYTLFKDSIKDDKDCVIDYGYHNGRGSFDIYYEDKLLVLNYGFGGNSWFERYYDTSNGKVSRFFERPIQHTNSLVACFVLDEKNKIVLVVQDIFDSKVFYKEIYRDFSDLVLKNHIDCEFQNSDTELKITYWLNNNQQVTETIKIR